MHSTMTLDMLNNEVLIQSFYLSHKSIPQLLIVGTLEGYTMKETDSQIVLCMPHCSPGNTIISYLKKTAGPSHSLLDALFSLLTTL